MCPECNRIFFFNKSDNFSTKCENCNVEMVCIGEECTSTEEDERQERIRNSSMISVPIVNCPSCNSINTSKISTTRKIVDTALFGLLGTKRYKTFHCNDCGYEW